MPYVYDDFRLVNTGKNVQGLYDGPFPWENMFGFHLAGMVGHDFLSLIGDLRF